MTKKYDPKKLNQLIRESNEIEDEFSSAGVDDGVEALETAIKLLNDGPITPAKILEIHGLALKRVNPYIAGRFRAVDVMVGGRICPPSYAVGPKLEGLCTREVPVTEADIKRWHVDFEKIHPFEDGNGRTGRIIMAAQAIVAGLPLKIIKASKRHEYYKWFNEVRL